MPTFHCFDEEIKENLEQWTLNRDESHHLVKVLRAKSGDWITLLNGRGLALKGNIESPNAKGVVVSVNETKRWPPNEQTIHLAVGIPKIKTLDTIIKQATEIGVSSILFLNAERSEVPKNFFNSEEKLEKLRRTAKEACKQSENPFLPKIEMGSTVLDWLSDFSETGIHWVAHPTRTPEVTSPDRNQPNTDQWLLVGPEGGLTDNEFNAACDHGFQAINLGSNILRVETACVTLAALAKFGPSIAGSQ